ncbi:pentapeptide repeat-containing protein [Streptomyces niveus]|uniref:pentapeptide repeat-containing protein n=1 Tax=Streptomyces niveus TaxID=193462 RepID=UPI0035D843E4
MPLAVWDLSGADLIGVYLSYADPRSAVLIPVKTDGTVMTNTRLDGVRRGSLRP